MKHIISSYTGTLTLTDVGVMIQKGLFGGGFLPGAEIIPYEDIFAVEFKRGGETLGYLHLILYGVESRGPAVDDLQAENTIHFQADNNKEFEEAKRIISEKILEGINSVADLEKLSELKVKNIITQEEFDTQKKKILES